MDAFSWRKVLLQQQNNSQSLEIRDIELAYTLIFRHFFLISRRGKKPQKFCFISKISSSSIHM